jgi:hypothetical protein
MKHKISGAIVIIDSIVIVSHDVTDDTALIFLH